MGTRWCGVLGQIWSWTCFRHNYGRRWGTTVADTLVPCPLHTHPSHSLLLFPAVVFPSNTQLLTLNFWQANGATLPQSTQSWKEVPGNVCLVYGPSSWPMTVRRVRQWGVERVHKSPAPLLCGWLGLLWVEVWLILQRSLVGSGRCYKR